MKKLFYPRLAWDGLRKNRQLSWPYLLTCVGMVAMLYILSFLASPGVTGLLPMGASSVATVLTLGQLVIVLFSLIFLFYTHSFLLRRRAREFGLYNVLGMSRWNLARVVTWESVITALLSLAGGLLLGVGLSKLAELGLMNLVGGEIDYRLRVDGFAAIKTACFFAAIFGVIWLAALMRALRGTAVNLMKSESVGERPPRGNGLLAALGVAMLGAAYLMAVGFDNPLDALRWFFLAVLLVIVATYILMIAGSVRLCRALQANRDYYYQPRHFVSVSSMAWRMKRNGAGLASICVIATMVLVLLSATACLWFGTEDAIRNQYPREINLDTRLNDVRQLNDANLERIRAATEDFARERGVTPDNARDLRYVYLAGVLDGTRIQCDYRSSGLRAALGDLREVFLMSEADYAARTGAPVRLAADEAMLLLKGCDYGAETLTLAMGDAEHTFRVASAGRESADRVNAGTAVVAASMAGMTVVVPDLAAATEGFDTSVTDADGVRKMQICWIYGFDTGLSDAENMAFGRELSRRLETLPADGAEDRGWRGVMVASRAAGAEDFHASNGALFFIGIVLSFVFLLAAVLIIYYKQVSEGYEDAKRFDIMQKVGMTQAEIRGSVSSQLLTVFALPLAFAGLHLAFAFPMIRRVLTLFSLYNAGLFVRTTLVSFAVFAAFYWVVYRLTSGVYCRIVSGAGE